MEVIEKEFPGVHSPGRSNKNKLREINKNERISFNQYKIYLFFFQTYI